MAAALLDTLASAPALAAPLPRRRATLPLSIRVDASADDPRRRYGLGELCLALGAPFSFGAPDEPAIYNGRNSEIGKRSCVWIIPSPHPDWARRPPTLSLRDGVVVAHHGRAPESAVAGNRVEFDLGLATLYWLTLQSESRVDRRDMHGRPLAEASPATACVRDGRPPVHGYCELLRRLLWGDTAPEGCMPTWPCGKSHAVALTHDVDSPERAVLARGLVAEIVRGRTIPRRQAYYAFRGELAARGWYEGLIASTTKRREWDFAHWVREESRIGARSAFFFAPTRREQGHPHDVHYDLSRHRYRRVMRQLIEGGFEVGLHVGYATRWSRPAVAPQARRVEALGGGKVSGVRHHYLQLNHDDPMSSLAEHAAAGLQYDTSIGFNDAPGFRAGLALPFRPWHPQHGTLESFVELPMTLADMHLPRGDGDVARERVLAHLRQVRQLGGLAVLNWHVGHWSSDSAWREAYLAACEHLAADHDAWIATPREIADWWRKRAAACAVRC